MKENKPNATPVPEDQELFDEIMSKVKRMREEISSPPKEPPKPPQEPGLLPARRFPAPLCRRCRFSRRSHSREASAWRNSQLPIRKKRARRLRSLLQNPPHPQRSPSLQKRNPLSRRRSRSRRSRRRNPLPHQLQRPPYRSRNRIPPSRLPCPQRTNPL